MAAPAHEERDWYTGRGGERSVRQDTRGRRVAADRHRLIHDVVLKGARKERRFPKAQTDALDRWPGYGARPTSGSSDALLQAELERQRDLNAALQREVADLRAGRAAAEMRMTSWSGRSTVRSGHSSAW